MTPEQQNVLMQIKRVALINALNAKSPEDAVEILNDALHIYQRVTRAEDLEHSDVDSQSFLQEGNYHKQFDLLASWFFEQMPPFDVEAERAAGTLERNQRKNPAWWKAKWVEDPGHQSPTKKELSDVLTRASDRTFTDEVLERVFLIITSYAQVRMKYDEALSQVQALQAERERNEEQMRACNPGVPLEEAIAQDLIPREYCDALLDNVDALDEANTNLGLAQNALVIARSTAKANLAAAQCMRVVAGKNGARASEQATHQQDSSQVNLANAQRMRVVAGKDGARASEQATHQQDSPQVKPWGRSISNQVNQHLVALKSALGELNTAISVKQLRLTPGTLKEKMDVLSISLMDVVDTFSQCVKREDMSQAMYTTFKENIKITLAMSPELNKPDSCFKVLHDAVVSCMRAFFRIFDVLFNLTSKQTWNDTPGREPFIKPAEPSFSQQMVKLDQAFKASLDLMDAEVNKIAPTQGPSQ